MYREETGSHPRGWEPVSSPVLQLAGGPSAYASGRWNVGGYDGYDITNANLHLVIAHTGVVILCEEHEQVMGEYVGIIGMVGEGHLPDNGFLRDTDDADVLAH